MRLLIFAAVLLFVACSTESQAPLVANDVVITTPPPGMPMRAAYMSLRNNSAKAIEITRVSSAQYDSVQLHETTVVDGVARMRALPTLEIPAGKAVVLERGGKHLMLMDPIGNANTVSLQFFDNDSLLLTVNAELGREKK